MIGFALAVAAAAASPPSASPPSDARDALDQLQHVYQQSCGDRGYGVYNDTCAQMRREIRAYRRTLAKGGPPPAPVVLSPPPPLVPDPSAPGSPKSP